MRKTNRGEFYHVRSKLIDEAGPGEDGDIYEYIIEDHYGFEIAKSYNEEHANLICRLLQANAAR